MVRAPATPYMSTHLMFLTKGIIIENAGLQSLLQ